MDLPVYDIAADGFVTRATEQQVEALDLYGLTEKLQAVRAELTGSQQIWKEKACSTKAVFCKEMVSAFLGADAAILTRNLFRRLMFYIWLFLAALFRRSESTKTATPVRLACRCG